MTMNDEWRMWWLTVRNGKPFLAVNHTPGPGGQYYPAIGSLSLVMDGIRQTMGEHD